MIYARKRSTILMRVAITLLMFGFALSFAIISQIYNEDSTSASNTLDGLNEVIVIGDTTDSLPINNVVQPYAYSGDGNVILFYSTATNLPDAGSTPGGLYIYNIKDNNVDRVDISTNGSLPNASVFQGGGGQLAFRLSETGRYVTFASNATNLIDGITKPAKYIYRRDTQTNTTSVIGAGYVGGSSDKWDSGISTSNDGRYSLVVSMYLGDDEVYPYPFRVMLGDSQSGSYSWKSLGNGLVGAMSCDGAFAVGSDNLYDLRKDNPVVVATGFKISPIISCNGRYVLYATTDRTQITPTPQGMDAYLHLARYDRITGERIYIDSNSSNTFSTGMYSWGATNYDFRSNIFNASIADTGDVVFKYKYSGQTYAYIKHLSDGSGTLEPVAKTMSGSYVNIDNGEITSDGRYIFFNTDPYNLGIGSSPVGTQIIRARTNI